MRAATLLCQLGVSHAALHAQYETVMPEHISDLMMVYLEPSYNREWNQRMGSQEFVHDARYGDIVHQTYGLPWPLKTRELLMHCTHQVVRSSYRLEATCASVHSDAAPITEEMVRMEILQSKWRFEALPNGAGTKVATEIWVEERFSVGIPSVLVGFVQNSALKESVTQFRKAVQRLKLPPHRDFVQWRRQQAAASGESRAQSAAWWRRLPLTSWLRPRKASSVAAASAPGIILSSSSSSSQESDEEVSAEWQTLTIFVCLALLFALRVFIFFIYPSLRHRYVHWRLHRSAPSPTPRPVRRVVRQLGRFSHDHHTSTASFHDGVHESTRHAHGMARSCSAGALDRSLLLHAQCEHRAHEHASEERDQVTAMLMEPYDEIGGGSLRGAPPAHRRARSLSANNLEARS